MLVRRSSKAQIVASQPHVVRSNCDGQKDAATGTNLKVCLRVGASTREVAGDPLFTDLRPEVLTLASCELTPCARPAR